MGFTTDRLLLLVVVAACSSPQQVQSVPVTKPRLVAHRGASHDYPENTMAAFRRAFELGCESIELDVHLSKDGTPVVIHDASTKRVAGVDRAVADQTLQELQALDAGRGERIPSLAAVLAATPAGRTVFVELKSGPDTVPVVAKVVSSSHAKVALQSFDADTLAALSKALPNALAFWTVDPPVENDRPLPYRREVIDEAKRRGFHGLALFHGSVDDAFVATVREANLELDVWTVNDAALIEAWLAKANVRWIETDRPELVIR
jgi:glycerophosphoryl diester phosphodiesterase